MICGLEIESALTKPGEHKTDPLLTTKHQGFKRSSSNPYYNSLFVANESYKFLFSVINDDLKIYCNG
jgi:hypothetical protein